MNDAPQTGVGDLHDAGGGKNRHLPNQGHRRLLKQQRKLAPLSGPWRLDSLDAMIRTMGSGNRRGQIAVMLEKIQMTPGQFGKVMGLTRLSALRARLA